MQVITSTKAPTCTVVIKIPLKTSIDVWEKLHHCAKLGTPKFFDNTLVAMGYFMSLRNNAVSDIKEPLNDIKASYNDDSFIISFNTKPNYSAARLGVLFAIKQINTKYIRDYYKEQCILSKMKFDKTTFTAGYTNFINAFKSAKYYVFGKCKAPIESIIKSTKDTISKKLNDKIASVESACDTSAKEHSVVSEMEYKLNTLNKKTAAIVILYKYLLTKESDTFVSNGISVKSDPKKYTVSDDKIAAIIKKYTKYPIEYIYYMAAKSCFDPDIIIGSKCGESEIKDVFKLL